MATQTEIQIITLEAASSLSLPAATIAALGLHEGSRLAVSLTQGGVLLQPLLADDLHQLRGIFSSDTDLVAELRQERRQDKW